MTSNELLREFYEKWPVVFAGPSLDRLTERAYRYRTLLNEISRGEAPRKMIVKQGGRKNLIIRDRFLEYWEKKLTAGEVADNG